jgi:hypothetical protein
MLGFAGPSSQWHIWPSVRCRARYRWSVRPPVTWCHAPSHPVRAPAGISPTGSRATSQPALGPPGRGQGTGARASRAGSPGPYPAASRGWCLGALDCRCPHCREPQAQAWRDLAPGDRAAHPRPRSGQAAGGARRQLTQGLPGLPQRPGRPPRAGHPVAAQRSQPRALRPMDSVSLAAQAQTP